MTTHTSSNGTVYQIQQNACLRYADLRKADLRYACLRYAGLQNACLRYAGLQNACLRDADLRDADLRYADLRYADLQNACLRDADLRYADLRKADLRKADLQGADLRYADLRYAKGITELMRAQLSILADGDLTGWKKCLGGIIVKLRIPAGAKRSNAAGRKCRAEYAEVLAVEGGAEYALSSWDPGFAYRTGETVRPVRPFNEDWTVECTSGIHFFITRAEAEDF